MPKMVDPAEWIPGQRIALETMKSREFRGILIPGPRGNGKTAAACLLLLRRLLLARGQSIGIVGVSAAAAKANTQPVLRRMFREMGWNARFGIVNGRDGIEVKGNQITFYSGGRQHDEFAMQGQTWEFAYFDELSNITPKVWEMVQGNMRGNLGAPPFVVATFNKKGPTHWTKVDLRDKADELGLRILEWPITENKHLPPEFLERLELTLTGAAYNRYVLNIDADEEGLVYSGWQRATEAEVALAEKNLSVHGALGVDYGPKQATTGIWLSPIFEYERNPRWIAMAEYHHVGYRDPMQHALGIVSRAQSAARRRAWCDYAPSRALYEALAGIGLKVNPPYKHDKIKLITHLQQALNTGVVKIAPDQHHLITELESVIWKADVIHDALDEKVPNDLTDALEYVTSGIVPTQSGIDFRRWNY